MQDLKKKKNFFESDFKKILNSQYPVEIFHLWVEQRNLLILIMTFVFLESYHCHDLNLFIYCMAKPS